MHLDEALRQIADIRLSMQRAERFHGYRSLTVAASGVLGLLAAIMQPFWVAAPDTALGRYLAWWIAVAVGSLVIAGAEMGTRALRAGPGLARQHTQIAVEQFLPPLLVGALLTLIIFRTAPQVAWMLPGLWALTFALGIFASCRFLPRAVMVVACYYIACGCGCLMWGRDEFALSPWLMGITFGGGQLLAAFILHLTLERAHEA